MKYVRFQQHNISFSWPSRSFHVALVEPEIPPNTGNIARLCAATNTPLHLVGKLGFRVTDSAVRRAGIDYWDSVQLSLHENFETFHRSMECARFFFFSAKAERTYTSVEYDPGDVLIFGSENRGLSKKILDAHKESVLGIPVLTEHVRSLNLATSVGIVLYEALRQTARINLNDRAGVAESADGQKVKGYDIFS